MDLKKVSSGLPLVEQWLRIRLPMQGTWVRSLVREDPTCLNKEWPPLAATRESPHSARKT